LLGRGFLLLLSAAAPLFAASAETIKLAQILPSASEIQAYPGLHAAAARGDAAAIERLVAAGEKTEGKDGHGRTPLHVAAHGRHHAAARALLRLGANPNALEAQRYDIVTIAAVNNDVEMLKIALAGGADPGAITSPYDGTALIAAAHLGHAEVVRILIAAKAPLDHVNNLGWTALIEAVILGDGGRNHTATVEALVKAGANMNLADRQGRTPLAHAQARGYTAIADILKAAGAR
jgi:ankyrin repeat protein